jgi:hypothetical protein
MPLEVYTFTDEGYVPAVVALVGSLRATGFEGVIHIGSPERLSIDGQGEGVAFHVLGPSPYWPGNRKAELLLAHGSERFVFLDADTVVTHRALLTKLDAWIERAPVVAVEGIVASIDARRRAWARRLGRAERPEAWPSHYFNSGFWAGRMSRDRALLSTWHEATRAQLTAPGGLTQDEDFTMADQDVLNAVLQDWTPPPIGLGPPDVWCAASPINPFMHVGVFDAPALLHCTGKDKPWKLHTVPARTPHAYDLEWYEHVVRTPGPLRVDVTLPPLVRAWFEGRPAGRAAARATRLWRRLRT